MNIKDIAQTDVLAVAMGIINGQISDEELMRVANLEQMPVRDEDGNIRMIPEPVRVMTQQSQPKLTPSKYPKL